MADDVCAKCGAIHQTHCENGQPRCQGHSRNSNPGNQCGRAAIRDRQYCKLHGGRSAVMAAHGSFVTGERSAFVPARLRARYEQALADPDLISMRSQMAVSLAMFEEAVSDLDHGSIGDMIALVERGVRDVRSALETNNPTLLTSALGELDAATMAHGDRLQAMREVRKWQEAIRKLSDTERKRLEALQQYVTVERMQALVAAVLEIIHRHVEDRQVLGKIQRDFQRVVNKHNEDPEAVEVM